MTVRGKKSRSTYIDGVYISRQTDLRPPPNTHYSAVDCSDFSHVGDLLRRCLSSKVCASESLRATAMIHAWLCPQSSAGVLRHPQGTN
jgi:hypothetical protein